MDYNKAIVINQYGDELDFDSIVNYMDESVREYCHNKYAPCTYQEFFDTYCKCHFKKFGEEFYLNTQNPKW